MKIRLLYIMGSIVAIALLFHLFSPKNIKSDMLVRDISFIYVVNYDYVAHSSMGLGKEEFFIDLKNRLIYEFQIDYTHYYILHDGRYERNPDLREEGYHYVSALSKEQPNFIEWKPSYIESNDIYNDEPFFDEHGHPIPDLREEGYHYAAVLSKEKIDKFLNIVKWSNFLEWKPSYVESNETYNDKLSFDEHGHPTYIPEVTLNGLQWFILIGYKDGTYKQIRGQNKYPPDWNTMFFAFEDMAGTPVLGAKMEWTEVFYQRFKAMISN